MVGIKRNECIGCGACGNICPRHCISMKYDFEGFAYPHYDKSQCINCGMCKSVCPVNGIAEKEYSFDCLLALAGYNKMSGIQKESTSGGIFSLLAMAVIREGGVVYGAAFNENFDVVHIGARDKEALGKLRKSKYVQSDAKDVYKEIEKDLKNGEWVLFSGTPCQIGALKSFLQQDYTRLLCVGIICHGVAAPLVWRSYLKRFHKGKEIKKIDFRDKRQGWDKLLFAVSYKDAGEYLCESHEDPFLHGFYYNHFLRKSCYRCKFKENKAGCDIILGDAWGADYYARKVKNENGTSIALVYSRKGKEWIKAIESGMEYREIEADKAIRHNRRLMEPVEWNEERACFYEDLKRLNFKWCMKKYLRKSGK